LVKYIYEEIEISKRYAYKRANDEQGKIIKIKKNNNVKFNPNIEILDENGEMNGKNGLNNFKET